MYWACSPKLVGYTVPGFFVCLVLRLKYQFVLLIFVQWVGKKYGTHLTRQFVFVWRSVVDPDSDPVDP
jgi:hypothetical protein